MLAPKEFLLAANNLILALKDLNITNNDTLLYSNTLKFRDSDLLKEYKHYKKVFYKTKAKTLPSHWPLDHAINIKAGKTPPFEPLYNLSELELKVLKNYININLTNSFISSLTSSAEAPILFTKKKDRSLRLCVNYQGLNNITIKDWYSIPLISEILNRLINSKVFTKLDLRGAYNLLWI